MPVTWWNCSKFERNRPICRGVIALLTFDLMIRYVTLWAVTLTFDPLTLKVCGTSSFMWSKSVRNLSEIKQSPIELLIANFCTHYVTLWPLTSWLWTFSALWVSCVPTLTKFEQNRIIYSWVIDDLARFRRAILRAGALLPSGSQTCIETRLHQTWQGHRAIMATEEVCFGVWIPSCIFKRGRLRLKCCWRLR